MTEAQKQAALEFLKECEMYVPGDGEADWHECFACQAQSENDAPPKHKPDCILVMLRAVVAQMETGRT